ncbi:MAG: MFS transporter [Chloroflexota bacterium]
MRQGGVFYGWVIVAAGLVVWILEPGMYVSFGVFFKPISSELGWTRATVSGAMSLASIAIGVLAPFSGTLSDRYGARRLVMASGAITGLAYALLSTTHSLWQFYMFYLLVGLGMGLAFAPITATVMRWFEKKRGLALGLTSLGTGIGGMFFPPLVNQLISLWGWRATYLVLAILLGGAILVAGSLLRSRPEDMGLLPYGAEPDEPGEAASPAANPGRRPDFNSRQAVRTRAFWTVFLGSTAAVFSFNVISVHLVPHATDRGLTAATAAAVMAMLGAGNSVGRLGLGALSDRVGRKRMFVVLLMATGLAMLFLTVTQSRFMFFAFALFFGMAYGGAAVTWMTLPSELFGLGAVGALTGLIMTGSTFGGALGSFLAGYIFDVTGSYSAAFSIGAVLLLLASGMAVFLKSPRRAIQ